MAQNHFAEFFTFFAIPQMLIKLDYTVKPAYKDHFQKYEVRSMLGGDVLLQVALKQVRLDSTYICYRPGNHHLSEFVFYAGWGGRYKHV